MARTAIEIDEAPSSRVGRAKSGADPNKRKQTTLIAVAVVIFAAAGVLIYINIENTPKVGDDLSRSEVTAEAPPSASPTTPATAPVPTATPASRRPAVNTPPVPGSETTAGPGSRTVGGPK